MVRSLDGLGSFPLGEYSEVNYWETRSRQYLVLVKYDIVKIEMDVTNVNPLRMANCEKAELGHD